MNKKNDVRKKPAKNSNTSPGAGYDQSAAQYSPHGRIFQIEYAGKAVDRNFSVVGLRGCDAVVLGVQNAVPSVLYERDAALRLFTIDRNIGMAVAGCLPDGQYIAKIAREEAMNYYQQFESTIPLRHLCARLSSFVHTHTLFGSIRPFGVEIVLSAWDECDGPQLYKIEPCGASFGYFACACGNTKSKATAELEKLHLEDMSSDALVENAAKIMYKFYNGKGKPLRYDMSIVGCYTNGKHLINPTPWYELAVESGRLVNNKCDDWSTNPN